MLLATQCKRAHVYFTRKQLRKYYNKNSFNKIDGFSTLILELFIPSINNVILYSVIRGTFLYM